MSPEEASAMAFMKDIEAFSPQDQALLKQKYFQQKIVNSPVWKTTPPEIQGQVAQRFGVMDFKPAAPPQGDPAQETKRALAPMQPGFSASDMSSVFKNPQASYGDKASAALGYLSHYPDMVTKAIAPPAFWRGHDPEAGTIGKAFDFLPFGQSYQVMGGIGADVGAAAAGGRGGWGEMLGGIAGGGAINPWTARRLGPLMERQFSSPILQKVMERFRNRGGGPQGPTAPGSGAPVPAAGGYAAPVSPPQNGVPAGTGGASHAAPPRQRLRFGPEGLTEIP